MPTITREAATHALRDAGLRVTAPRVAVLECLGERPHSSADALRQPVNDQLGTVSTQAIYDVLNALTEAGLVRRIEPAGHPALFETRTDDNHHHLVCRSCGQIEDVDCAAGERPCLDAVDDRGFSIDEAEVTYWGLCPACISHDNQSPTNPPEKQKRKDSRA